MSSQRFIYAFAVLASIIASVYCEDLVLGEHQHGDKLVESTTFIKYAAGQKSHAATATYTPLDGKKVTAVELYDRNGNKNGAWAKILQGGPGKPYITVGYYSNPGYAIEYEVKVYAI